MHRLTPKEKSKNYFLSFKEYKMMLKNFKVKQSVVKFIFVLGLFLLTQNTYGSTIMGMVYDSQRNPLPEIDVELLDDLYRLVDRARTTTSGRYEFNGLRDGRFTVRIMAFRYDFMDETASVEVNTIVSVPNQIGNGFFTQDFYLRPRKGSLSDTELGVVFAQDVSKDAEKLYQSGVKLVVQKKTDEGITQLREAVKIAPNYYLALHRLGRELFAKGAYGEAAQMSLKATEVNPKSATSFYYLGNSLFKLNYNKAAIIALNQSLILAPLSYQVLYVLGKAEIAEGKFTNAEKHLLEAKKLSKVGIPEIHWELAQVYGNNLKKYKEAADELELYLKTGKYDEQQTSKVKKLIGNFREKARSQTTKS